MRAAVVAVILATLAPTAAAGVFPKRYANAELFVDELMEHGDLFSSAAYIVSAYMRGFHAATLTMPMCSDGFYLEAVLPTECPRPGENLATCEQAAAGEKCVEQGGCDVPDAVHNCPSSSGVAVNVYRKSATFCRAGGASACQDRSKGLFVAAAISFLLSLGANFPFVEVFREATALSADPGISEGVKSELRRQGAAFAAMCSGPPVIVGMITLLVVAYEVPGLAGALVGMGVTAALVALWMWGCSALVMMNDHEGNEKISDSLNLPVFSLFVAAKLTPEKAAEVMDYRAPRKLALRVLQDIPELICGALDLWWYGDSWWAALDIAFSAALIVYHLLVRIFKACAEYASEVAVA